MENEMNFKKMSSLGNTVDSDEKSKINKSEKTGIDLNLKGLYCFINTALIKFKEMSKEIRTAAMIKALSSLLSITILIGIIPASLVSSAAPDIYIKGTYAVVSNQSTDPNYVGYTGLFSQQPDPQSTIDTTSNPVINDSAIDSGSYKTDYVKACDPTGLAEISTSTTSKIGMSMLYQTYAVGDTKVFWVFNIDLNSYYQIVATLKSSGIKSNVWVNTSDYAMTTTDANRITAEFDNNVSPKITSVFGNPSDTDGNGKVDILCFNIKDGFSGSGGYVAGYFDPYDLFSYDANANPNTNEMEVFYIDTYPAMGTTATKDVTRCYDTLAHEFQHMINFNQNVFLENNFYGEMDIWLQESMSEAASQVYSGQVSQSRINYYNTSTAITAGFSLINWTGYLENYSLAYLFSQYLKIQVGIGDSVFTEVMQSPYNDYRAVEDVIKKYISPSLNFGTFMTAFRAALFLKKSTGLYGFKGVLGFSSINQKIYNGSSGIILEGGAAIVIPANATTGMIKIPAVKDPTINYFIIQNPPIVTISSYITAPTNADVVVNATTDVGSLAQSSHTFSANGSYEFVATNLMGDVTRKTVTISNIDKIPPSIYGVLNAGNYSNATISFSDGSATLNGVSCASGAIVRSAGVYALRVTDAVGNVAISNFTISTTTYAYANGNLTRVEPATAFSLFKTKVNLFSGENVTLTDRNGTAITVNQTLVGTGMTLKIMNGSTVVNTNIVVIYGDLDGDAQINVADLVAIRMHLLKTNLLTGAFIKAADMSNKGKVSISDVLALKRHILNISPILQSTMGVGVDQTGGVKDRF